MAASSQDGLQRLDQAVRAAGDDPDARRQTLLEFSAEDIEGLLHAQFSATSEPVAAGLGASPGAAVGAVCFTADAAVDAFDAGADVILVKDETSPEDVHGMAIAEGILTSRGGLASHAAVVARGWGKPAVCGAEAITIAEDEFRVGDHVVLAGDIISIDGATGEVFIGAIEKSARHSTDAPESGNGMPDALSSLLEWADDVRRGVMAVRANADTAEDANRARGYGAEGIGLCRTEHQFLGDRLPAIRRFILATEAVAETAALDELAALQRQDFVELLEAMDGLPVTVRLLDPPLHEFLPDPESLAADSAAGTLDPNEEQLLEAARQLRETNPMLGTRGVRLGILRDGLYHMQVEALLWAVAERRGSGGRPIVEIMVPLVVDRTELALVRSWIDDAIAAAEAEADQPLEVLVGTMVETPRAALRAEQIALESDFLSFGTNDLTQMTFGFSRDDVESRIVPEYLRRDLLDANPFETIDRDGVGTLVQLAAEAGRSARPDLKLGICGEHGGDPQSIEFFHHVGLDYVSCSPFRVPVARLAVAQAIVRAEQRRKGRSGER